MTTTTTTRRTARRRRRSPNLRVPSSPRPCSRRAPCSSSARSTTKLAERVVAQLLGFAAISDEPIRVYHLLKWRPRGIRRCDPRRRPLHQGAGEDGGHGLGGERGRPYLSRRQAREPLLPAQHALSFAPALGRGGGRCLRHLHRGAGNHQDARALEPHHRARDGTAAGERWPRTPTAITGCRPRRRAITASSPMSSSAWTSCAEKPPDRPHFRGGLGTGQAAAQDASASRSASRGRSTQV